MLLEMSAENAICVFKDDLKVVFFVAHLCVLSELMTVWEINEVFIGLRTNYWTSESLS